MASLSEAFDEDSISGGKVALGCSVPDTTLIAEQWRKSVVRTNAEQKQQIITTFQSASEALAVKINCSINMIAVYDKMGKGSE